MYYYKHFIFKENDRTFFEKCSDIPRSFNYLRKVRTYNNNFFLINEMNKLFWTEVSPFWKKNIKDNEILFQLKKTIFSSFILSSYRLWSYNNQNITYRYINGEKADPVQLRVYPEMTNAEGLKTSRLGLVFKVSWLPSVKFCTVSFTNLMRWLFLNQYWPLFIASIVF